MDDRLRTALLAAQAAAAVHGQWLGRVQPPEADEKGVSDFVTQADLEAQRAALDLIRARHPDDAVLAEEEDGGPPMDRSGARGADHLWIVDPLDGTTNFLHRYPQYCASVGVVREGEPWAGAVVASRTGERWWARRGRGAWKNGLPVRVSTVETLDRALVGTGFPFKRLEWMDAFLGQLDRVLRSSSGVRRAGSAAMDLCQLAEGSLDAFWELHLAPWDVAAGLVILSEAGGVARRPDGRPVDPVEDGGVVAANGPGLLEALRERLELEAT